MDEVLNAIKELSVKIDNLGLRIKALEKKVEAGYTVVSVDASEKKESIADQVDRMRLEIMEKYHIGENNAL